MTKGSSTFLEIVAALESHSSAERQAVNMWFFKTGPGEYGEGDQFMGVRAPDMRLVSKEFKDVNLDVIKEMLYSPVHEIRLCGLFILVGQYESTVKRFLKFAQDEDQKSICDLKDFYLEHRISVNNWDLVDSSAHKIFGAWLRDFGNDKDRLVLYDLAKSKIMWDRRIAVVSCFALIKAEQFDDIVKLSEMLLSDSEDLMHKAVGWMLREAGKKDIRVLRKFLEKHCVDMPRTMLRYSIEKFVEKERKMWLQKGKQKK